MNKKPVIVVLIGLILGITFLSQYSILIVLQGYRYLLDGIARLSISNPIGNVLSWLIVIGISFIPSLLYYFKGGNKSKAMFISLAFSIFVFVANVHLLNAPSVEGVVWVFKIVLLSLLYITGLLAYYFEIYYKRESHLQTLIMSLLYISLLSYGMILGTQIVTFYNSSKINVYSNIIFVISVIVIYFNISLLLKLETFFSTKLYTDLNQESLRFIRELKIKAEQVIAVMIYGLMISVALTFLGAGKYDTTNIEFIVPIGMIMISIFINLYLKLLINAISVKEENNLFI